MREQEKKLQKQPVQRRHPHRHGEKEKARQAREKEQEEIVQGYEDEFSEFEDDYDEPDDEDVAATREVDRRKPRDNEDSHR